MPYTNDMATLAQVVSPVDAAMQSGQQDGNQNISDAVKNNIAQQTMPQEIQKASMLNQLYQAQAQNEQGLAMQNQAKGLTDMQTQPSTAAATVGGNQAKLSTDQLTKMNNLGGMVQNMASFMDQVPPPARQAMLGQILDQAGVSDPGLRQGLTSVDPQQLPQALRQIGDGLIQHSASYQTEAMKESEGTARATTVAQIQGNARTSAAEASANARIQAANISRQMHESQQTFEQAAVRLQSTNPQLAQQYAQAALQLRQAQAGITNQLVQGEPLQMPNIQAPGGGDGSQPVNAAPAQGPAASGGFDPSAAIAEAQKRGLMK